VLPGPTRARGAAARTVVDLTRDAGFLAGVVAGDAALRAGLVTREQPADEVVAARRGRGVRAARRMVDLDFWWRKARVAGEFDGRSKYGIDAVTVAAAADQPWDEKLREDEPPWPEWRAGPGPTPGPAPR